MPYPSRITRTSTRGRSKKRVPILRSVDRIEPIEEPDDLEVNLVPAVDSPARLKKPQLPALEDMLDKLLVLTQRWEKITALVALATTNLTGNRNLGTLLEIVARGRNEVNAGSVQDPDAAPRGSIGGLGNINISELLSLAESLLKTGQQDSQDKAESAEGDKIAEDSDEAEPLKDASVAETSVVSDEIPVSPDPEETPAKTQADDDPGGEPLSESVEPAEPATCVDIPEIGGSADSDESADATECDTVE